MTLNFSGFSQETLLFFSDLEDNNDRNWFNQNRHIYDKIIMPECQAFVEAMGEKLKSIAPDVHAIPKIDQTIFRIYRDTRFSKDKRPYKTHIAMFFWEGDGKKLECSGFYFHLDARRVFIGVGIHEFTRDMLQIYRDSVVHPQYGHQLVQVIKGVHQTPDYQIGWKKYKKEPRGYDRSHPNAQLLLYGGMGFQYEEPVSDIVFSSELIDRVFSIFQKMSPIHFWLRDMAGRS
ncbi:DUF2461 domain-containing protein [candidate division KSB1 bacterium]|nr:DUF2461 domain-containing protein [candidate division KSB1 bacterium]